MNLSMKRKQTHRQKEQTCDCHGGGEVEVSRCKHYIHGGDKQQGPTVWHR